MDQLGRFVDERCVIGDMFSAPASALYAEYKHWSDESGEHVMSSTAFGMKLVERGFGKRHTEKGGRYERIGLRTEANPDRFGQN